MASCGGENGDGAVWLIAGPTASGKSRLALDLALATGGEIINADASQVYRDLCVITARPEAADLEQAPHHLYGVAEATDPWSVGRWLRTAVPLIEGVRARGVPAIVVGGTGLYFSALTKGLADAPATPPVLRDEMTALYEKEGEAAFRARLAAVDPAAEARISPHDRQRLVRALAVHAATGRALSDWRAEGRPMIENWRGLVLEPERPLLYARCDARVAVMAQMGAWDEARGLAQRGLDPDLPLLKAVGYREFASAALGECAPQDALEAARMQTRRYAKRQTTWFRNQQPDWPRLHTLDSAALRAGALEIFKANS